MNLPTFPLLRKTTREQAPPARDTKFESKRSVTSPTVSHHILPADAFGEVFEQELRRAERSHHHFILMKVSVAQAEELNGDRQSFFDRLALSLLEISRDTDYVGWLGDGSILAVIFTELGSIQDAEAAIASIKKKVKSVLERQSAISVVARLPISFSIFPEKGDRIVSRIDPPLGSGRKRPGEVGWIYSRSKRLIDILGSAFGLLLLFPLFFLIAVVIKMTSPGPVLFRQERVGQDGVPFTFLKFRSMRHGNDNRIHRDFALKFIAGFGGIGQGGVFKLTEDPRITRVGRFLRKTSLDELPQLWNVLHGEMSLVGPRPALRYEIEAYDTWHRKRFLSAKPGITGLWQVSGRSKTTFDEMVRLDLRYARASSFWLDAQILWRTPIAVIRGSGAY